MRLTKSTYLSPALGALVAATSIGVPAEGGILGEDAVALQPFNELARQKLGPVMASNSKIVFFDGESLDLTYIKARSSAEFGDPAKVFGEVQVFRVGGIMRADGVLPSICNGRRPSYLLAFGAGKNSPFPQQNFLFFSVGAEPTSIVTNDPGSCAPAIFLSPHVSASEVTTPSPLGGRTAAPTGTTVVGDSGQPKGKWRLSEDTNVIDDSTTVHIMLDAKGGGGGEAPTLVARCKSNKTELFINWNDYLGDDSSSPYDEFKYVTIRVGDQAAERQRWGLSTDSKATFAPGWAGDLLKEMRSHTRLVAETVPYNENPKVAVFDIAGLEAPLTRLSEVCGWTFD